MKAAVCKEKTLLLMTLIVILSGCKQHVSFNAEQLANVQVSFASESYLVDNCYQYQYDSKTKNIWFFSNFLEDFDQDESARFWGTVLSISTESYKVGTFLDLKESEQSVSALYVDGVDQSVYVATFRTGPAPAFAESDFALNCYSMDGELKWTNEFQTKINAIARKGDIRVVCGEGIDQQIFWISEFIQMPNDMTKQSSVCDMIQNGNVRAQLIADTEEEGVRIKIEQQGKEIQTSVYEGVYPAQIELLYVLKDRLIYRYDAQIICWDIHSDTKDVLMEADNWPKQCMIYPLDQNQIAIGIVYEKGGCYTVSENLYDLEEWKVIKTKIIQMMRDERLYYMPTLFYYSENGALMGVYRCQDDSVQVYRYIIGEERTNEISIIPG